MPDVFFLKLPSASQGASTAKGIGLQMMDDAGQPIALDTDHSFNGFNTTDTDFKTPLAAAYYRPLKPAPRIQPRPSPCVTCIQLRIVLYLLHPCLPKVPA